MKLTMKQKLFINEYLSNGFNATQAAISAGYSEKTARVIGQENLCKPYIKEEIERIFNQKMDALSKKSDDIFKAIFSVIEDEESSADNKMDALKMLSKFAGFYEENGESSFGAIKETHRYRQIRTLQKKEEFALSESQWNRALESFNNTCAYCGARDKRLQQEHFIPLSKGGEYTVNNIIPACSKCNRSKYNYSFFEWYPKQEFYSKEREKKILDYLNYNGEVQQLALV